MEVGYELTKGAIGQDESWLAGSLFDDLEKEADFEDVYCDRLQLLAEDCTY